MIGDYLHEHFGRALEIHRVVFYMPLVPTPSGNKYLILPPRASLPGIGITLFFYICSFMGSVGEGRGKPPIYQNPKCKQFVITTCGPPTIHRCPNKLLYDPSAELLIPPEHPINSIHGTTPNFL